MDFEENRFSIKGLVAQESDLDLSKSSSKDSTDSTYTNEYSDMRGSVMMKNRKSANSTVKLEDFDILNQLGRGTFGRVYLAELKVKGEVKYYAIKAIRKDVLIEYDQVQSTMLEKDIMFEADHPFLVGMDYLFQSETRLYFVMPFVRGGELYKVF
jgi:serine/threonine protein kinase